MFEVVIDGLLSVLTWLLPQSLSVTIMFEVVNDRLLSVIAKVETDAMRHFLQKALLVLHVRDKRAASD
jgi:hypothetical protein